MTTNYITHNQNETEALGATFAKELKSTDVVALSGGLGAGKTAFVRGALKALGAEGAVTSPTFNIVNEYRLPFGLAAHFDLYRIELEDDLEAVGFYDYLDRALLFIEWSENIENALHADAIRVAISGDGDEPRAVTIISPER